MRSRRPWLPLVALLAGCGAQPPGAVDAGPRTVVPVGAAAGDELVATVVPRSVAGSWREAADPGAVIALRAGDGRVRHAVLPGGVLEPAGVALGAWDGAPIEIETIAGSADFDVAIAADASAAGVPVVALRTEAWWTDAPLVVSYDGATWTYVFTNEDGGTGLFPTLLMAAYGRPVDIEGLLEKDGAGWRIQTQDPTNAGHAWIAYDGPYEGTHPRIRIATSNGLAAPDDGAVGDGALRVAPMPTPFAPTSSQPREAILDALPWLTRTSFDEVVREGKVVEDGGPTDAKLGVEGDYLFVDLDLQLAPGVLVEAEAEVGGAWISSVNIWGDSGGPAEPRLGAGASRTAIELSPGKSAADVTSLRIVAIGAGQGTVRSARWFRYDAADAVVELGAAANLPLAQGAPAVAF